MTDVLKQLPPASWRGILFPITSRNVDFAHETVEHPLAYRDGQLVEQTGARNWTFKYTVPMREDIQVGPYVSLFTQLSSFVAAMRDRMPGELNDPIYGVFRCVPMTFADATDTNRRDGTDLTIEFMHAPEIGDEEPVGDRSETVRGASEEAGRIDDEVALVDWEQEEPPQPSADPLSVADGLGRQVLGVGDRISAKLDDTAFRLEKLETTIDRLERPDRWPLKRSSRRLRDTVIRIKKKHDNPARRIRQVTINTGATVGQLAQDLRMTLQELLRLNPRLAEAPLVAAGTPVFFFEGAASQQ